MEEPFKFGDGVWRLDSDGKGVRINTFKNNHAIGYTLSNYRYGHEKKVWEVSHIDKNYKYIHDDLIKGNLQGNLTPEEITELGLRIQALPHLNIDYHKTSKG